VHKDITYIKETPKTGTKAGAPNHEIISRFAIKFRRSDTNKVAAWACIKRHAKSSCSHFATGASPADDRVLRHVKKCKFISSEEQSWAMDQSMNKSTGQQLENALKGARRSGGGGGGKSVEGGNDSVMGIEQQVLASTKSGFQSSAIAASTSLKPGSIEHDFTTHGKKLRQLRGDHHLLKLVCVHSIVPRVFDTAEWKDSMAFFVEGGLNRYYKTPSASHFFNSLIPSKGALVHREIKKLLLAQRNLTLTFDGIDQHGHSIYTLHAVTQDCDVYFLEGHEVTGEVHNGEFVKNLIVNVMSFPQSCLNAY
jgi:hypothetical protein